MQVDPSFSPPPRPIHFVNRSKELSLLAEDARETFKMVIAVLGISGIGKTSLVSEFLYRSKLPSLWLDCSTMTEEIWANYVFALGYERRRHPVICVLENWDETKQNLIEPLNIDNNCVIAMSRTSEPFLTGDSITLSGLSRASSVKLLLEVNPKLPRRELSTLVRRLQGHPLALVTIGELLKSQTVDQVLGQLDGAWSDLHFSLPFGETRIIETVAPQIIIANESLIQKLKETPEDVHRISPRRFEELVAELLDDMGWEVKLTPESKDGGKDILAVLNTDIGKFLTLVEAKHYSPKRPVQVGLVRQLFGTFVDHGANSAMLVTSSRFTKGAKDFQQKHEYQLTLADYGNVISWIQRYKLPRKKLLLNFLSA